jgi:signal transduction histidine kinase
MVRSERRLEQLIDDLIQFSMMARGELSLNKRLTSASDLVRTVSSKLKRLARAGGVDVQVDLPVVLPKIEIDYEKISWVLMQLLDNAIKFTPPGGWVRISGGAEGGLVTFRVTDSGIGISKAQISEIFEPFHQLDGADSRRFGGVGLGLALVRRIIEMHGSIIRVDSEIGKGSTFEFSLPAYQDD